MIGKLKNIEAVRITVMANEIPTILVGITLIVVLMGAIGNFSGLLLWNTTHGP